MNEAAAPEPEVAKEFRLRQLRAADDQNGRPSPLCFLASRYRGTAAHRPNARKQHRRASSGAAGFKLQACDLDRVANCLGRQRIASWRIALAASRKPDGADAGSGRSGIEDGSADEIEEQAFVQEMTSEEVESETHSNLRYARRRFEVLDQAPVRSALRRPSREPWPMRDASLRSRH